ncbi:MliC family protein [Ruegeria aquimaris]|uniref:MliC family protein n=1 Tax=Ruegeria aquimaris TaxID=2984333 RepID=A0ABT3AGF5_9RHOB|nr:MliC family protein [Ruegeria sp. XHP0148]MCV2887756.1 MliC family protein [Ruegeria sp. XHP0148]
MRAFFAACLLLAAPAFAQEGPSFDCSKAQSDAEQLICQDADLARLDRLVTARYVAALDVVEGLDTGAERAKQSLRAEQRGWIKGRDECWKADDLRTCIADSYLRREGELVARWMLEEPAGIAFWACGGNPANEVATYFYATELPSVRFERGDSVDTGSLVPTGSGSRYEASFGRSIWIKGDNAIYRDPDPDGSEWDCVLASNG